MGLLDIAFPVSKGYEKYQTRLDVGYDICPKCGSDLIITKDTEDITTSYTSCPMCKYKGVKMSRQEQTQRGSGEVV